jgi:hypothetical protein
MDRGKTVYPPPPSGSGGIIMVAGWFIVFNATVRQCEKTIISWGRRDRMVVGFIATCTISAYHHLSCEFEPRSQQGVLDTTLCDKV